MRTHEDVAERAQEVLFDMFKDINDIFIEEFHKYRIPEEDERQAADRRAIKNSNELREILLAFETRERRRYLNVFIAAAKEIDDTFAAYSIASLASVNPTAHFFTLFIQGKWDAKHFEGIKDILLHAAHHAYMICHETFVGLRGIVLTAKLTHYNRKPIDLTKFQEEKNSLRALKQLENYNFFELLTLRRITDIMLHTFTAKYYETEVIFRSQYPFHTLYRNTREDALLLAKKEKKEQDVKDEFAKNLSKIEDGKDNGYRLSAEPTVAPAATKYSFS